MTSEELAHALVEKLGKTNTIYTSSCLAVAKERLQMLKTSEEIDYAASRNGVGVSLYHDLLPPKIRQKVSTNLSLREVFDLLDQL